MEEVYIKGKSFTNEEMVMTVYITPFLDYWTINKLIFIKLSICVNTQ